MGLNIVNTNAFCTSLQSFFLFLSRFKVFYTFLNIFERFYIYGLHRHECKYECESESGFAFTGCLSLVQASPARVERSRSLVQAHNSTRVYRQSPVKSNRVNALRKK